MESELQKFRHAKMKAKWRKDNPEKVAENRKKHYSKHKEYMSVLSRGRQKNKKLEERLEILEALRGKEYL